MSQENPLDVLRNSCKVLTGKVPTETELTNLARVRDGLALRNSDGIWLIFVVLEYYKTYYESIPASIKEAARESRESAAAGINAGVEFAIRKGMEAIAGESAAQRQAIKSEAEEQIIALDKQLRMMMTTLRETGFAAGSEGMKQGAMEATKEFQQLITDAVNATKGLKGEADNVRSARLFLMGNMFFLGLVGGLIGAGIILLAGHSGFHWF